MVNDTAYTFLNSWNDDISDSSKHVETSKKPIKDNQTSKEPITDTHIVNRVRNDQLEPLMWTQSSPDLESLGKGELGILVGEASPKALFTVRKV